MEQRASGLFVPENKDEQRRQRIESDAKRAVEISRQAAMHAYSEEGGNMVMARLAPEIFRALQK